jgi:hypothetical protein
LPRDQFDKAREQDGWVFAQEGDGNLALRSRRPFRWQANPGEDQNREMIAEGNKNTWICELGRSEDDGSFAKFVEKICSAEIRFKGLSVQYQSPSQGLLEFGWKGALRRDGAVVPLGDYPRYDNPYCQTDFWAEEINTHFQSKLLKLDWKTGERLEAEI